MHNPNRFPRTILLLLTSLGFVAPPAHAADHRDLTLEGVTQLANDSATKMLASSAFQARIQGGRKARIVLGDVRNFSDNEGVRVDDVANEIRNRIVQAGTARIFAPGTLEADFVISPELSSEWSRAGSSRKHCFTLQLTLSTPVGEYVGAFSASHCE
jgi:hypothetical protein